MRPTAVLVRFRPGAAASETGKAHRQAGGSKLKEIPGTGVDVVNVPRDTVQQKIASYRANPNVDYAEPDFYRVLIIPDKGNEPGPSAGGVITDSRAYQVDVTACTPNTFTAQAAYLLGGREAGRCSAFFIDGAGARTSNPPGSTCWTDTR